MDTSTTVTYTLSLHDALPICICRLAFSFIERLVGQRVGFAILLTIHVVDAERVERLRHFLRAFVERLEIGAFHFVLPAHLFDQQLGVALDANGANSVGLRVVHRRDEAVVFRDVVGKAADVLLEFRDRSAVRVADQNAVSRGPGIAARAAVNVDAIRGSSRGRLWLGSRFGEEALTFGSWRTFRHQAVDAGVAAFAEPSVLLA